ncbi:MAG: hypothetical protein HGA62_00505 [Chlorobiaceae bacterium]|nr:hypothetical protein [Chlorobiaceae bacterium]NTV61197.1 hypothetical protein [Chlorobiaceae bacterium]
MPQERVILEWITETGNNQWFIVLLRKNSDGIFSRSSDSACGNFPLNPDGFGPFDEDTLIMKIREVFPGAEIMLLW